MKEYQAVRRNRPFESQSTVESRGASPVSFESQTGDLAARITELEHGHRAAQEQVKRMKLALDQRQARVVELESLLTEQRAKLLDLENHSLLAIEEAQRKARRAEQAWFAVYAELEQIRARSSDRATAEPGAALDATALLESRRRAETLSAEVSILRVRAVKSERQVKELEEEIAGAARLAKEREHRLERSAGYARRLEIDLAKAARHARQGDDERAAAKRRITDLENELSEVARGAKRRDDEAATFTQEGAPP